MRLRNIQEIYCFRKLERFYSFRCDVGQKREVAVGSPQYS